MPRLVDSARLRRRFRVFSRMARIPLIHAAPIWLIIDEIISNTAAHADGDQAVMSISLHRDGSVVRLVLADGTRAFDPRVASSCRCAPEACLESMPVGGWGLRLVAGLSDARDYRRRSHRNIFTIWYILPRRRVRYRGYPSFKPPVDHPVLRRRPALS